MVYVLMLQVGESANSVGVFDHLERAYEHVRENFVGLLLTCAAGEYGEPSMTVYRALQEHLGKGDLKLIVRDKNPDEIWIDAHAIDDTKVQPAMFTITKLAVDRKKATSPDGGVKLLFPQHETKQ